MDRRDVDAIRQEAVEARERAAASQRRAEATRVRSRAARAASAVGALGPPAGATASGDPMTGRLRAVAAALIREGQCDNQLDASMAAARLVAAADHLAELERAQSRSSGADETTN